MTGTDLHQPQEFKAISQKKALASLKNFPWVQNITGSKIYIQDCAYVRDFQRLLTVSDLPMLAPEAQSLHSNAPNAEISTTSLTRIRGD